MKVILYIGDFDFRNENVQAHLVKNMGLLFGILGYKVIYIGVNRKCSSFKEIGALPIVTIENGRYYELPYTLSVKGIFLYRKIEERIIKIIEQSCRIHDVKYLITYQSPTFSAVLSKVSSICGKKKIPYIVNSADITKFDSQPFFRRMIMELNWKYLHYINYEKSTGIIAVSQYISSFYKKKSRPSTIIPPLFDNRIKINKRNRIVDKIEFIYAGTPFPNIGREVNVVGMKDRLDKIIDLFMEVKKINDNFIFKIIGINLDDYITAVPRHKNLLKNNKNIVFLGRMSHIKTLNNVANANYMINYRDKNKMTEAGLSTKVVESVSLGTPVIMSDVGDTFLYLKENFNGYKLTGSFEKDVRLLLALLNLDSNKRTELEKKCVQYNPFKIDNYVDILKTFLSEVDVYNKLDV